MEATAVAGFPFCDGFESGSLGASWTTYTTIEGRVQVSSTYPYTGTSYSVLLDDSVDSSAYSHAAIILTIDLSGRSEVDLDFWWREFSDENDPADGVFISDDNGASWYQALSFNNGPSYYRNDVVDIDAAAAANGLTLNDHFQIKFQFYDNYSIPADGYAIDEVRIGSNRVLIIQDRYPWGYDSIQQILNANGVCYDQVAPSQIPTIDLSPYWLVIIPSNQSSGFYSTWNANIAKFQAYVEAGGALWLSTCAYHSTSPEPLVPGGVTNANDNPDHYNDIIEPTHPWVAGVPSPIYGNYASHDSFTNLYPGSLVVVQAQMSGNPTLVDYMMSAGRVLITGQTLEWAWARGEDGRPILSNSLLDMYGWSYEPGIRNNYLPIVMKSYCGPDTYEPNAPCGEAEPLTLPANITSYISCSDVAFGKDGSYNVGYGYDYFSITIGTGGTVNIALSNPSGQSYDLFLYQGDCSTLIEGGQGVRTISRSLAPGTYYILVYSGIYGQYSTSPYSLQVTGP